MQDYLKADKPYAITAADANGKVKIVTPKHPAARMILAHKVGDEVVTQMMVNAGLADENGNLTPKEYDDVATPEEPLVSRTPIPAGYVSPEAHNAAVSAATAIIPAGYVSATDYAAAVKAATATVPAGYTSDADVQAKIDAAVKAATDKAAAGK